MRRFFISDTHFYHANILKFGQRNQFANLEEMHEHLINSWNRVVHKKDVVYVVGDFSFGDYEQTKVILDRLNGSKVLVLGNHDLKSKRHISRKQFYEMGFIEVADELIIKLSNAQSVYLKHYPYKESVLKKIARKLRGSKESYRAYHQLYPARTAMWHIHGHHHGQTMVHGNEINVSCETLKYKPISESEIVRIMNEAERSRHAIWKWIRKKGQQLRARWLVGVR